MKKIKFDIKLDKVYAIHEAEIKYRTCVVAAERKKLVGSWDAAEQFRSFWDKDLIEQCEEFKIMYLNRANHIICVYSHARGNDMAVTIDIKSILYVAVECRAKSVILSHNHPSGNTKPSSADETITTNIKTALGYFDIKLVDHIIITADSYLSFADEGLI